MSARPLHQTVPDQAVPDQAAPHRGRTLFVVGLGTVVALVAYTVPVANLAGTAIGLDAGAGAQAWILSSMSLGLAMALLPSGAVGDGHGRRRTFVAGSAVLAAAAVLGALAPTALILIGARIGQGLGAAAVISCGLGLIGHTFPAGPPRARATGVWGACVGGGIALGPLLAAGLDGWVGWRGGYWALAGLSLVLAVLGRWLLRESGAQRGRPADLVGMTVLGAAMAALLAGLVEARTHGPGPLPIGLLAGGVLLGALFVLVERHRAHPMLDLGLVRRPDFAGATVGALATGTGVIATMSFLPTVIQRGMGHGVWYAALALLAWSGTSVLTALLARRIPAGLSARTQLGLGLLGVAAGQAMLAGLGEHSGPGGLLPGLLIAGAASGVLNAALGRQAVASVPAGLAGVGSGANNTARYLGAAVGVTVVSVFAAHPVPAEMFAGWHLAVMATAASSVLGGLLVLAIRPCGGRPRRDRAELSPAGADLAGADPVPRPGR